MVGVPTLLRSGHVVRARVGVVGWPLCQGAIHVVCMAGIVWLWSYNTYRLVVSIDVNTL